MYNLSQPCPWNIVGYGNILQGGVTFFINHSYFWWCTLAVVVSVTSRADRDVVTRNWSSPLPWEHRRGFNGFRISMRIRSLKLNLSPSVRFTISSLVPNTVLYPLWMFSHLRLCSNCRMNAVMKCTACLNAPEYRPDARVSNFYCGRDFQKEHWSSHKPHCCALGPRRELLRTAEILKAALLTYREILYDVDVIKTEL
jgi:hypothetical protein